MTGGNGFVGSHIVEQLLLENARVRITVHTNKAPGSYDRLEVVRADLSRAEDCLRAARGVDYIFHAAGSVGSAAVKINQTMHSITTNLILTSQMLQAGWSEGVKRFLLFSSSTGYPVTDHPVKEEEMWSAPPYPGYFGYGWMRRYLERLGEYVHQQSEMKVAIVRPTAVYGRRDNFNPDSSHVIPALIRKAAARENPFIVWGTGHDVRDFLHISDLARGCLLALEKHAQCDPINIGYGKGHTIRESVAFILEAADLQNATVVYDITKPSAIPKRIVDTEKARTLLGFEPRVTFKDGLKDTYDWYIQNHIRLKD